VINEGHFLMPQWNTLAQHDRLLVLHLLCAE
jgi:hypothetical protein